MAKVVLFLCTGNYYRSRFAEEVFNDAAAKAGIGWRAESRGLALERGCRNVGPMSRAALGRLGEIGVVVAGGERLPLGTSEVDLKAADLVVALKGDEHRPLLLERHPGWAERVEYWDEHDDYDLPPEEALPRIEAAVRGLVDRLGATAWGAAPNEPE